jgi:hypothetical protein
VPSNRELRATRLLEIAEPILEAAALNKRVTIAAGDLLRQVRVFLPNPAHTSEVQADHIADERKMVAADLYLWLAGSNDNRFIRAWTDDPARVDSLREAIGLEPARYYAAPAQPCGGAEQADEAVTLPQPVLDALRFYANGHHYNIDDDHQQFDTVSGEPQNWLFSERDDDCTMIEDGRIAKAVLQGIATAFEEPSPPIEGEVFATRAKNGK